MPSPVKPKTRFGRQLRTFRRRKGWSQKRLAEELGYSQQTISLLEVGGQQPTEDQEDEFEVLRLRHERPAVANRL